LPDIALLKGGRAEPVFDRFGQDAAVRHLYGVDLDSAS
jgi:hypothetical protein